MSQISINLGIRVDYEVDEVIKCIETLIEKGANVNARDLTGRTPLHTAEKVQVIQILIDNNADINAKDEKGATPLHISAQRLEIDYLKCLVANGAKINEKDSDNNTPLHCAGDFDPLFYQKYPKDSFTECCQFLILSGADFNSKNNFGRTPLDKYLVKKRTEKRKARTFQNKCFILISMFHN